VRRRERLSFAVADVVEIVARLDADGLDRSPVRGQNPGVLVLLLSPLFKDRVPRPAIGQVRAQPLTASG
jgi:hypothetical protein